MGDDCNEFGGKGKERVMAYFKQSPEMTGKTHKYPDGITDHCTINQIPKYKTLSE